jgi:hypothetical protein
MVPARSLTTTPTYRVSKHVLYESNLPRFLLGLSPVIGARWVLESNLMCYYVLTVF